jgi:hypothetical protein
MASLLASQRACSQLAGANCREPRLFAQIQQRGLPQPVGAAPFCCPRDSRRSAGVDTVCDAKSITSVRGQLQIVQGASKASLYTQLPDRLDEPTPGFDSIAAALEDLAAGRRALSESFS